VLPRVECESEASSPVIGVLQEVVPGKPISKQISLKQAVDPDSQVVHTRQRQDVFPRRDDRTAVVGFEDPPAQLLSSLLHGDGRRLRGSNQIVVRTLGWAKYLPIRDEWSVGVVGRPG